MYDKCPRNNKLEIFQGERRDEEDGDECVEMNVYTCFTRMYHVQGEWLGHIILLDAASILISAS